MLGWLVLSPAVRIRGTASPAGTGGGDAQVDLYHSFDQSGSAARVQNVGALATDLRRTVRTGRGGLSAATTAPSTPAGESWPTPVAQKRDYGAGSSRVRR